MRRPSGQSSLRGGLSAASSANAAPHVFNWDLALKAQIEGAAVRHFPKRDKPELARIAKENYKLVQQGSYLSTSGAVQSLKLGRDAVNRTLFAPSTAGRPLAPRYPQTSVCVARTDTATALRTMHTLGATRAAALNFANASHPGGGYLHGARAQEEDLCRLLPTLYSSLKRLKYPMKENSAAFTQGWLCRTAGSYALDQPPLLVNIISAAMPDLGRGAAFRGSSMRAGSPPWEQTVRTRIRAVLHAAREERCDCVILGAFGCGAFANPPDLVAPLFADVLASDEFRGAFAQIVFAILEFKETDGGNVSAFVRACGADKGGLCEVAAPPPAPQSAPQPVPPAPHGAEGQTQGVVANACAAESAVGTPSTAAGSSSGTMEDPMDVG